LSGWRSLITLVADNLENIQREIRSAALKAGRKAEEIKLVAVVKNVSLTKILEAIAAGVIDLGENKVQEAQKKFNQVPKNITWHLVGHLQTNKAKYAVKLFELIHSLDSLRLAQEINKWAKKENKIQKCLVQVNISGEKTKFGLAKEEVIPFLKEVVKLKNITVEGLMTIAPLVEDPEETRPVFAGLRELAEKITKENIRGVELKYLSMGMTNDFQIAIEEGSNMIRIGRAIFERREKH